MKIKRGILFIILIVIFSALLVCVCIESRPSSIVYSSVFTTSGQTEIHLYVEMNTFFRVKKDAMAEELVTEHRRINSSEGKVSYTLHLYRTTIHYKKNCKYDTIICNENGAIICCGD